MFETVNLFVYDLFNDSFVTLDEVVLKCWMVGELERKFKGSVIS